MEKIMKKDDTISRQDAINTIMGQPPEAHYPSWYAEQIKKLPSAQPERKKGRWVKHDTGHSIYYDYYFDGIDF